MTTYILWIYPKLFIYLFILVQGNWNQGLAHATLLLSYIPTSHPKLFKPDLLKFCSPSLHNPFFYPPFQKLIYSRLHSKWKHLKPPAFSCLSNGKDCCPNEVSVAHACNPSYSGGRDRENSSSKPALANSFMRLYLEKTHHKKGLVEWLKMKALSSNPSTTVLSLGPFLIWNRFLVLRYNRISHFFPFVKTNEA
jgi:hypothetical protein